VPVNFFAVTSANINRFGAKIIEIG